MHDSAKIGGEASPPLTVTSDYWEGGLCCSRGLETSHHSCIEDPELIHFLVALAVFHQDDLMKKMN